MKNLVLLTAMLVMVVAVGVSVAVAQTEPVTYVGYITSISGDSVLVDEDPQDPVSDGAGSIKGYFTVTGGTEFFRLVGGDAVGPATFEELQVGQLVSAMYSGPVLESYPPQGGAGSITILAEPGEEPVCNIAEGCDPVGYGTTEDAASAVQYAA